jgi:hypothetical protein
VKGDGPCAVCSQPRSFAHPDPCLGWIEGAAFACCGHGVDRQCYLTVDLEEPRDPEETYQEWIESVRAAGLIEDGDYIQGYPDNSFDRHLLCFYLRKSDAEPSTVNGLPGFFRAL